MNRTNTLIYMALKGTRKLELFYNPSIECNDDTTTVLRRGRSEDLITKRNELIIARMYWYRNFHGHLKNDFVMAAMTSEFFLSAVMLTKIMNENYGEVMALKTTRPDIGYFERKWKFLNWRRL